MPGRRRAGLVPVTVRLPRPERDALVAYAATRGTTVQALLAAYARLLLAGDGRLPTTVQKS